MKDFILKLWFTFIFLLQLSDIVYMAKLRLYCGTLKNFIETELDSPLTLLRSGCYNSYRDTVIYAFGFTENPEGPDSTHIIRAYLSLRKYNVFLIDWEKEAHADNMLVEPVVYVSSAAPNTIKVGKSCGQALIKMSKWSLNLSKVHLVGHSLGAHLMGYCGKEVQKSNRNVSRITGLDPAGPLYEGILSLDGLDSSSAAFVDGHHTNAGFYGTIENIGKVDVWYNCDKSDQPNCTNETLLTRESCNHRQAWLYFSEAVLRPTSFAAVFDESCDQWKSRNETTNRNIIYIGNQTDRRARGNYYITTNAHSPFGRGQDGLRPSS